jgi:hypothetical protein
MTAQFVSSGAVSTAGGGSTITVALPSTVTQGNLLLILADMSGRSFTSITNSYTQIVTSNPAPALWVGFKFAGASETAPVLTASSSMTSGSAVMVQYSGVTGSTYDVTGTISNNTGTSITAASITTTANYDLVLSLFGSQAIAATWTEPSGTSAVVNSPASTSLNGLLIAQELFPTTGVTGTRIASISASQGLSGVLVAFKANPPTSFFFMMN